ncbi:hypothetical protein FQA39_LY06874 [Lamprigera yunnana]|nr:hypothetical protein FQA39_LY06874 [Lamprigera yunnana]
MSRRTPVKEIIAEEIGAPSSPMRRSSRIARRSSVTEDNSKKSVNGDHDDSDRVSVSSASSVGSKKTTKEEKLQNETEKGHARRTPKRRGSTSSLVDEELSSINIEAGSPARITRRSMARAMSASPLSESMSQSRVVRTPKKPLLEGSGSKKGRSSSLSDGIILLESIEEILSPKKDLDKKESDTTEKDLPIKKKKAALLQTITEKSFIEDLDHSKDESFNQLDPITKEPNSQGSDTVNITKYELTPKAKESLNSSTEEKELIVLLNSVDGSTTKDSLNQPETTDVGNKDSFNTPHAEENVSEKATALKNTLISSDDEIIDVVNNKPDINNALEVIENQSSSIISEVKETKTLGNQDKMEVIVLLNNIDPSTPKKFFNLLKTKKDIVENEGSVNILETKDNNISKNDALSSENEKIEESETEDTFNLSESNVAKNETQNDLLNTCANEKSNIAKSLNNTVTLKKEDINLCISGENDKSAVDDILNTTLNVITNQPSQSENDLNTTLNQSSNKEDTFYEPMDVDTTIDDTSAPSNIETLKDNADTFCTNLDISVPMVTIVSESVEEKEQMLSKDGKQSEIDSTQQLNSTIENSEFNEKLNGPFDSDISIVQQSPTQSNIDSDMSKECDNTSRVVSNLGELINSPRNLNKEETMSSEIITSTDAQEASTTPSVKKTIDGLENSSNPQESSVSPDQSDKASQNKNKIIVATEVTPLRRSPRNLGSPEKKTPVVSKQEVLEDVSLPVVSPESGLNHLDKSKNISMEESPDTKGDIDEENLNVNCETDHNTSLEKKLIALTETLNVDSSSDESVSNFIDAIAEEGEEDTPSENSNDIIDLGESINSTESELDSNESYELDSFLTDDEDVQLLSGEEYDLGQDKKHKRQKKRIISPSESSGDGEIKPQHKITEENSKVQKKITAKGEEDSDVDRMSTRPYCGLTPPSVVSVRDSPTEEELKTFNKVEEEIMVNSVLINVEDNLESLEHIKERSKSPSQIHKPVESPKKITPKKLSTDSFKDGKKSVTPNNSISEINTSQSECKHSSSLTIQETLSAADIEKGTVSDHIYRVVEAFCANVSKSGNISLNVSLDYSPSSDESTIHEEHKQVIRIESMPTSKTEVSSKPLVEAISTTKGEVGPKRKKKSKKYTGFDESTIVIEEQPSKTTKKPKSKSGQNIKDCIKSLKKENQEKAYTSDTNLRPKKMKRFKEKLTSECYEKYYSDSSRDAADFDTNLSTLGSEKLNFKKPKVEKTKRTRNHEGVEDLTIIKKKKRLGEVNVDVLATAWHDIKQNTSKLEHAALSEDNVSDRMTRPKSGIKTKARKVKSQAESIYDEVSNKKIKFTSTDMNWEIQYLPDDLKAALNRASYVKEFKDEKFSKPHRKPKLVPSVDSGRNSWSTNKMTVSLKPTTNIDTVKKTKGAIAESFHSKDFKNRILYDSARINRMETKELLKKKNKKKS